jgi:hypothetical protein
VPGGWSQTPGGGWVPVPDPTTLTEAAVQKAKDDVRRELAGLRELLEKRMDCQDAERRLLLQIMDERTAETNRRFAERDVRFDERDRSRQEAVRTALDAASEAVRTALAAAKELSDARDAATDKATGKFETSVREQIAQLGALSAANRDQLSTQIQALKERIDRGEGSETGASGYRAERRLDMGQVIAAMAVIVAVVVAIISILHK